MTDVDNYDADADALVLMTMHAAKGLEFPIVFLPGFEDGIFPGMQTLFRPEELEEDRRLCYVALTRAKKRVVISCARSRMLYGSTTRNRPSRFLQEMPPQLLETHEQSPRTAYGGFGGGYQSVSQDSGYTRRFTREETTSPVIPSSYKAWSNSGGKPGGGIGTKSAKPAPSSAENWQVGDTVEHKTFGIGNILNVQPMGNDLLLTIAFDKAGTKKIMATFAKLTKV